MMTQECGNENWRINIQPRPFIRTTPAMGTFWVTHKSASVHHPMLIGIEREGGVGVALFPITMGSTRLSL